MKNLIKKLQEYRLIEDKQLKKQTKREILETLKTLRIENTDMWCCEASMYNEKDWYIPCDKCYWLSSNDCDKHKRKEFLSILSPK